MVDIDDVPRTIGADFSVWEADSKITLTNVTWDNNYRDIVKFANQAAFNKWIDARKARNVDIDGSRHYRINEPIRIQIPFTEAYGFNYVRVLNPAQAVVGNAAQYSYYFIIGVDNTAPGVTTLTVQLDVWQTFGHLVSFGNSYVERGHVGVANEDQMNNWGRDFLTLPEGLETGSDHKIVQDRSAQIMSPSFGNILVIATTDLRTPPGDSKKPSLFTSRGSRVFGTPSGADYYVFTSIDSFIAFIKAYQKFPWVLQGIQSITAIPDMRDLGYKLTPVTFTESNVTAYQFDNGADPATFKPRGSYKDMWTNWRKAFMDNYVPKRYRHLNKFLTSPYSSIEITFFNGAPVVIKPELWAHDDAPMAIKTNVVAPGQRTVAYPRRYNGISDAPETKVRNPDGTFEFFRDGGEYLGVSVPLANFPTFAIVANGGALSLANQARSIAQQYTSADWSQQKALRSNETSYDQATAGNNAMQQGAMIGRNAAIGSNDIANQQNILRTIVGGGSGLIGGAMGGNLPGAALGAATGAANTALDIQQRNAQLGISNQQNVDQTRVAANQANYMRDTNKSLSDWSARGDYEQSIASITAKVRDTAMTPPFTAGQAGGDTFNYVFNDNTGIQCLVRWKLIPPAELRMVGEYWLRYGYAVRQFYVIPASLMVMTKFTYWKLSETYLKSSTVPEFIKQMIRGIFEKGVTVWASPDDIGVIDVADNMPLPNITLGNKL